VRFGAKSPDLYELVLDIEVDDVDHLDRIVASLRATPVVTHLERSQG
jgi:(p)ppGpp synthase/HD superfamily hydrolase